LNSLAVQATHVLLDIVHCPPEANLYQTLREESETLLKTQDAWNSAETFNKMHVMDSAIRESLRVHPMLIKGLSKEVVAADGVDLPGGTHLAQGAWIGVPTLGIHRDERFYPNATMYDPFRFVRLREAQAEASGNGGTEAANDFDAGKPSTTYLGFGYGRRAW
jgi:cytochrome P450